MILSADQSLSPEAVLCLEVPDGNEGVLHTLDVMRACVDDAIAAGGPTVELARRIAAKAGRGTLPQAKAVYEFLMARFVFRRDPIKLEHLTHPDLLATQIERDYRTSGDCDDVAMLGAALLLAMGIPPALIVVSIRPNGQFHHVLFGAQVGGRLITLDPQERMYDRFPKLTNKHVMTW